jgi:Putative esterase
MIAVTFQHPTPYYDDSYAVNSANNGPYGDAIMTELIPYIEAHFRVIDKPYARVLTGGSTGGWEALALQLYHPNFFGGAWIFCPDPIDFRRYFLIDVYDDDNAFVSPKRPDDFISSFLMPSGPPAERSMARANDGQSLVTARQFTQLEAVLGSRGRSGHFLDNWEAVYGPVGEDGYPKPLWNKVTGEIDHQVATYMREHGYDLRYYAQQNWRKIGPALIGKLHFYCGDMDNFYLNLAVYLFEDFLKGTSDPYYGGSFQYGRPMKGHGWSPITNAELVGEMAAHVAKDSPSGAEMKWLEKP